ncbi:uncharacterized protein MEPE_02245 [Melanopsichium pennsylvanicum]|uniref:DUF803-domain-containing protein n=2 Tax=Melanopsichium pennsylvanicum TaxID=63383 RepID=A0AAJ4XK14_9BASI|nr:duf803-domain-containing protein [Melanopsichium pennsylvanicum 4]SNX83538.1 uncharacterized protein MEPE_02245 [Melanopsichium pennsylvanicum]
MDTFSSSRTWIGVVVAVAGNVTISLALNCQKLAHTRLQKEQHQHQQPKNQRDDELESTDQDGAATAGQDSLDGSISRTQSHPTPTQDCKTKYRNGHASPTNSTESNQSSQGSGNGMDIMFLQSKLWWLGLSLMTVGEAGNFISYGFAPASLVAPLGAVALLSNVIISPILLGETFKLSDIGGITLAIIGAVTVVFSSKQSDARLDPSQLLDAIKRLDFLIYSAISVSCGVLLASLSTTRLGDRWVLIDVGTCAIFGGFTVLSTKGISSLISGGQPIEALKFPITYCLVIVLAATAVVQITYLNRALQRFDSREVIPTQFVFFTISAIVGSAILYRDFANMDAHRLINFLFGCLTTFGGVFVLTWRNGGSQNKSEDEDENDEEAGETTEEGLEAEGEDEIATEGEPLLSHSRPGSETSARGRLTSLASTKKANTKIDFLEPAFEDMPRTLPRNALRVPDTAFKSSPAHRPRSRTNSPRAASARFSGSYDRTLQLSRSASNQPTGVLSTSSSAGLRTPKLSLMSIDRPTGLSAGHYLLLATPPPSFTLNPVQPIAGNAVRGGFSRGLASSQYGATGNRSGSVGFMPFPVTTPPGSSSKRTQSVQERVDAAVETDQEFATVAQASAPTRAESIVSPTAETNSRVNVGSDDLESRLAGHVTPSR